MSAVNIFYNKIHKDFIRLFLKKESKELFGSKYLNFWILTFMMFITFMVIGFSKGSLNYLKKKMQDPFIKSVNIIVPVSKWKRVKPECAILNKDSISKAEYGYQNLTGSYKFSMKFFKNNSEKQFKRMGRSIYYSNPLLNDILVRPNLILGRSFIDEMDCGIIVTERLLKELGYSDNFPSFIDIPSLTQQGDDVKFPLPIIAIVNELPGNSFFATTPYFYNLKADIIRQFPFSPKTDELIIYTMEDSSKANIIRESIDDFLLNQPQYKYLYPWINPITKSNISYFPGYEIVVTFDSETDTIKSIIDSIFTQIQSLKNLKDYVFSRIYKPHAYLIHEDDFTAFDYITVNFVHLDRVEAFKTFLKEKNILEIDMAQIESKKNFSLIASLTRILSIVLIGFSIVCICLFLSNILKNHLISIKTNIGTFMAFGIDNKTLQKIYINLISRFILLSMLLALIVSALVGYLGLFRSLIKVSQNNYMKHEIFFKLFDYWTIITLFVILLISTFVLFNTTNKILTKTPGDLVYQRQGSVSSENSFWAVLTSFYHLLADVFYIKQKSVSPNSTDSFKMD